MFADMGHFDRRSIRTSWLLLVYPCLVVNYLGQGVCLLVNPSISGQVFYGSVPVQDGSLFWLIVLLASSATVVASQALISGAFSITRAAIRLHFAPELSVVHTSASSEGHIYIPPVNYLLMVATCSCVVAFGSSTALANAYGVAVCCDMVATSVFLCVVMRLVWHRSYAWMALYIAVFGTVDLAFLLGNLVKIEAGGWLPLSFALALSGLLFVWEWGQRRHIRQLVDLPPRRQQWALLADATKLEQRPLVAHPQHAGCSVFFFQPSELSLSAASDQPCPALPFSAWQLFSRLDVLPSRCVFVEVTSSVHEASLPQSERLKALSPITEPMGRVQVRHLTLHYGYMDSPALLITDDICAALQLEGGDGAATPHWQPTRFVLTGEELVQQAASAAGLGRVLSGRKGRWSGCRARLMEWWRRWVGWLRTLPAYWLMTAFNFLSRGTCHGDEYRLPSQQLLKLVTKIQLHAQPQVDEVEEGHMEVGEDEADDSRGSEG